MKGAINVTDNRDDDLYPSSDGEPMGESEAHIMAMMTLILLLRQHFRDQPDVFVIGNMFWYYEEGNPQARKAPDLMVVKGVDPSPRRGRMSFKSWNERATPCFTMEITSPVTDVEDRGDRFGLYRRLGVREYFLFDPEPGLQSEPLEGYRLVGDEYEQITPGIDGSVSSQELGLQFVPDGASLTLIDLLSGRRLLGLAETAAELEQAQQQLESARKQIESFRLAEQNARLEITRLREKTIQATQRAEAEKGRADAERQRARAERLRADTAAAEVERLKALLAAVQQPPKPEGPRS